MDSFVFYLDKYWELIATCVFSVISTIYFTRKYQKSIKPIYTTFSSKILNESEIANENKIKILYKNNEVKSLTITKLAFWNSGKQTLKYEDHIAEKDPFRIEIDDEGEILDYEFLYQIGANEIEPILKDNRIIYIPFNYFTHNEGFVLKIYHTGKNGKQIRMCGSLKEDAKIERVIGNGYRIIRLPFGIKISNNVYIRINGLICFFVAIICAIGIFLRRNKPLVGIDYFFVFIIVTYMILGVLVLIKSFKANIPKIMRDKLFDD